jgi:hypothetical protein
MLVELENAGAILALRFGARLLRFLRDSTAQ